LTQADEPQRLSKLVAARVPCSRREAEQYIAEGWVRVDGTTVNEPQFRVTDSQHVEIDSQARLQPVLAATLLLHKPAGASIEEARSLLGAAGHWAGDKSGIRRTKAHTVALKAPMPLPPDASGLSVFSQDARVLRKLTQDAALIERELVAEVTGTIAPDGLARLRQAASHVSWQSETRLRFAVKAVEPERIASMCAQVGLRLVLLKCIRIGRVPMAGLPVGQWRYLLPHERF
jgi:23S rRNA pseudouridine2604 synthase